MLVPLPLISYATWRYSGRYRALVTGFRRSRSAALVEETVSSIWLVEGLGRNRQWPAATAA